MRLNAVLFDFSHHLKKISSEQRFTTGKTQSANAEVGDLIYQVDGPIGVETVIPPFFPIITTDALGLAVFGQLHVRRERSNRGRKEFGESWLPAQTRGR